MGYEHDSPQWYDIIHFEHKLSWLYFRLSKKSHTNGENILWLYTHEYSQN